MTAATKEAPAHDDVYDRQIRLWGAEAQVYFSYLWSILAW